MGVKNLGAMGEEAQWQRLEVTRVGAPSGGFPGPADPPTAQTAVSAAERLAIQDVVCRAASRADLGDFAGAQALYTADATFDYSGTFGPGAAAVPQREFWAAVVQFVPGFDAIHHQLTNFVIRATPQGAACYSCVYVVQQLGRKTAINAGMHRHDMVRTDDGWRIRHQVYQRRFHWGEALVEQARMRLQNKGAKMQADRNEAGGRPADEDRLAIQDAICSVTLYADLGNLKGAASLFAAGATLDYSSISGPEARALDAAEFWSGVQDFFPGFDATQHMVTNFDVRQRGNEAECTSAVRAMHRIGAEIWTNGGFYYHRLVKGPAGWRITHLRYDMRFEEGRRLVDEARRRVESSRSSAGAAGPRT